MRTPLIIATIMLMAGNALAETTLTVDRWDDDAQFTACTDVSRNDCTLRGAIIHAHQLGEMEVVRIEFDTPGDPTYGWVWLDVLDAGSDEDGSLSGDLDITKTNLSIDGNHQTTIASRLPLAFEVQRSVGVYNLEIRGHTYLGETADRRAFWVQEGGSLHVESVSIHHFRHDRCPVVLNEGSTYFGGSSIWGNRVTLSWESGAPLCHGDPHSGGNQAGAYFKLYYSTVAGNSSASQTAAVWSESDLVLEHATIADNTSSGSEVSVTGSTNVLLIEDSIIRGTCSAEVVNSRGGNIESPGDTCHLDPVTDQIAVEELFLLPFGDYGGPWPCFLPQPWSPAVDDPLDVMGMVNTLDQRGLHSPEDGNADSVVRRDSDAVERQPDDIVCPQLEDVDGVCVLDARDVAWMIMRRAGAPPGWDDDCTGDGFFGSADHPCVVNAIFE